MAKLKRSGNRKKNELRPVKIETGVNIHAEGSVLISMGNTKVICTASVENKVPRFLRNTGKGWVTAEYSMLPRSTSTRMQREISRGRPGGRTMEIQRLIGRAMRAVVRLDELGERTIWIDCDVIQADGGTRTASATGGFTALCLALNRLKDEGKLEKIPLKDYLAAVSVGIVDGEAVLDLDYEEDYRASTDKNIVMTGKGKFVEIQGTAEEEPFSRKDMDKLITLAAGGIKKLVNIQKSVLPKSFSF